MTFFARAMVAFIGLMSLVLFVGINLVIDRYEAAETRLAAQRESARLKWEFYRFELDQWKRRDVVSLFAIEQVEFDGATVTIWGYLSKRACPLNIGPNGSPYSVVDFVKESHETRVGDRLYYQFGGDEVTKRPISRPPGTTAVKGWKITIGADPDLDDEIVAFAVHNCGVIDGQRIIIGPREFLRVTVRELLSPPFAWESKNADAPRPLKPGAPPPPFDE